MAASIISRPLWALAANFFTMYSSAELAIIPPIMDTRQLCFSCVLQQKRQLKSGGAVWNFHLRDEPQFVHWIWSIFTNFLRFQDVVIRNVPGKQLHFLVLRIDASLFNKHNNSSPKYLSIHGKIRTCRHQERKSNTGGNGEKQNGSLGDDSTVLSGKTSSEIEKTST
jgi:hypothetical protein